jgi:hypothetical protein
MTDLTPRQILDAVDRALEKAARGLKKKSAPKQLSAVSVRNGKSHAGKVAKPKREPRKAARRSR